MAIPIINCMNTRLRTVAKQFNVLNILYNRMDEQNYSVYHPHYISPVYDKKKQRELIESEEMGKLRHIPIKPALNNQTSSVYNDTTLMKFQNYVMREGKKKLARQLVEQAFEKVKRIQLEKYNKETDPIKKAEIIVDPLKILYAAVDNCKPLLQLSPIKRGGATYQVPVPISEKRAVFLSMNWLIQAGQDKEKTTHWPDKMAHELVDAAYNKGRVVKKKQELHRQCEANRAYAHYRWG